MRKPQKVHISSQLLRCEKNFVPPNLTATLQRNFIFLLTYQAYAAKLLRAAVSSLPAYPDSAPCIGRAMDFLGAPSNETHPSESGMQIAEFNLNSCFTRPTDKEKNAFDCEPEDKYVCLSFMKYGYIREPLPKEETIGTNWIYP